MYQFKQFLQQIKVCAFLFFRVQAPYTNSWKSDEAITELANFQEKMDYVTNGVEEYDIKDNIGKSNF